MKNIYGYIFDGNKDTNVPVKRDMLKCFATLQHVNKSVNSVTDDYGEYCYGGEVTVAAYFVHLDPMDKVILPALAKRAGIKNLNEVLAEFDRVIKLGNKILVTEEWF